MSTNQDSTYKTSTETSVEANLGHKYKHTTKQQHLLWLLDMGWSYDSPLIKKYVRKNSLDKELAQWTTSINT